MKKGEMKEIIKKMASADEDFLMNDLNGVDLMMDAVNKSIDRMKKKELLFLLERAKESSYYEIETKGDEE